MQRRQPRVTNYNQVRVLWTDEQCEYLLDQRMSRNNEFWNLANRNRAEFWNSIAEKINKCFGTHFNGVQMKNKWKNLLREYLVSIFSFKRNLITYGDI
jgi:hypothetical protein